MFNDVKYDKVFVNFKDTDILYESMTIAYLVQLMDAITYEYGSEEDE